MQYKGRYPYARERGKICSVLYAVLKLVVFHILNAVLGFVAFSMVVAGSAISIAFLPLCCFGVVVFRLVLVIVSIFAQVDVVVYNFVSPPAKHVSVQLPQQLVWFGGSYERLAPSLSSFSPLALMATLYFATIKFLLAILSFACVSITIASPIALLSVFEGHSVSINLGSTVYTSDEKPALVVLIAMFLCVLGGISMRVVANISTWVTRFFCCERFSTYRYCICMRGHRPQTTGVV